jgi:hypothetical protein
MSLGVDNMSNLGFPEGTTPRNTDSQERSLQKINAVLNTGIASDGSVLVNARAFRAVATFNRPGDTNAYAQFDAISNSTSAPTTPALAIAGAASGDFIDIRNVRLNTSTKPTGVRLTANVFLGAATFTATNDNAELSIDDTTAESGVWVPLANSFQTALNYRVSSDPVSMLMQLSSGSIFAAIQANNAWAPGNADKVTLVVEGFLYTA